MMRGGKRIIRSGIGSIIIFTFGYVVFYIIRNRYSFNSDKIPKEYYWLFKDSVRKDFDLLTQFSYVKKNDIYNSYIYKNKFYLTIWDFKNILDFALNDIPINKNASLKNVNIEFGETINVGSVPEISIKYGFNLDNEMTVNLDDSSKIDTEYHTPKFKGFYGTINKMAFGNSLGVFGILFDYINGKEHSLLILCRGPNDLYVLMVDSDNSFDPNKLIKIFNLPNSNQN